jgi:hypothetical protein
MVKTAKQSLAERFERKTAEGLVDVKFFLRNVAEATTDQVYEDLNNLYEAYERGDKRTLVHVRPSIG